MTFEVMEMQETKKSSSVEQQNAEVLIADIVEKWLGCAAERNCKVFLENGVHIEPDLYSEENKIVGEIYAHIGKLKGNQPDKIAQDILKMLLLEKVKGTSYRKIIVIVDETVEKQLSGKSYLAESIRQFGVEVKRICIDDSTYKSIVEAQARQIMR